MFVHKHGGEVGELGGDPEHAGQFSWLGAENGPSVLVEGWQTTELAVCLARLAGVEVVPRLPLTLPCSPPAAVTAVILGFRCDALQPGEQVFIILSTVYY